MMTSLTRPQTTTWPFVGQVAEVAGVVPAVLVLRGDEAAHRDVAGGQRLAAQLDDADAAGGQHVAVLVDDAGLEVRQQRAERGQPAGVALGRGHRAAQRGQQVGVDLVDHQAGAALGERHRQRGLGHAVGRQDRRRAAARTACPRRAGPRRRPARRARRPTARTAASTGRTGRAWPACAAAWRTARRRSSAPRSWCPCTCR